MAILLCHVVTVQDIQNNRPQAYALLRSVLNESHRDSAPRALHALSLHSQLLSHFYFRYKLYIVFKKIPYVLQFRRAAFHIRYFIFYRSPNRSDLYTSFSSIFLKLSSRTSRKSGVRPQNVNMKIYFQFIAIQIVALFTPCDAL